MTRRLYYQDSHIRNFSAEVVSCVNRGGRYAVRLDQTAFFPGGGGQPADLGTIGGAQVLECVELEGEIIHYVNCSLKQGSIIECALEWPERFRRMQNHSGEHILSGTAHELFGYDNVGFHMSPGLVTIDLSGFLTKEELSLLERRANEAVENNVAVRCWFPQTKELRSLSYRSKRELTENVRIVEFEGIDRCACCAPHVSQSSQIGVIKILTAERHRGGMRLTVSCGLDAYDDYRQKSQSVLEISNMLSAKQDAVAGAVKRVLSELDSSKKECGRLRRQLLSSRIAQLSPQEGNICLFEPLLDPESLRELVNAGMAFCPGVCAAFTGDDKGGYRYVIGSSSANLKQQARVINGAISGHGGGGPGMISGTAFASRALIEAFFGEYRPEGS